ncbi:MAG: hypothetical protein J5730_08030 [Bacteroidales bacterium]|nr:hypothetical protein [Bacteroidales bacterium]
MESQDSHDKPSKTPNKGTVFIIASLIGLLFGAIITLLVLDVTGFHHPTIVNMIPPDTTATRGNDTVVKYVIHKYEPTTADELANQSLDSLSGDSIIMMDESEDLTMDYEGLYMSDDPDYREEVAADKMLSNFNVHIHYLNNDKQEIAVPDQMPSTLQVQQWTTPIRNRMTYQHSGNTVKIKGLNPTNAKLFHYKNTLILWVNGHYYPIRPNNQFERLTESSEYSFPL